MPEVFTRVFNYTSDTLYITSANPFYVYRFRLNDPYDPDPLLLSTGCAGWNEINAFYTYWRVLTVEVDWSIIANQSNPVLAGCFCSPDDQTSAVATVHDALDALENNYSTGAFALPQYASEPSLVKFNIDIGKLSGDKRNYLSDNDYASTGSTNPNRMLFVHFVLIDTQKTSLSEGVAQSLTLKFKVKFYQRKQLFDP